MFRPSPLALPLMAACMAACIPAGAAPVSLYDGRKVAAIIHEDQGTLALAAGLLARDLEALTGHKPLVSTALADCGATCVVLARHDSPLAAATGYRPGPLAGQWERYTRQSSKNAAGQQRLLIAGADLRGAVYGVVDLSRELGVSTWEWWADVAPARRASLAVDGAARTPPGPAVQYRGIFLNDEDWGLQPWAAKTYETARKDIGPATYARIYELLWRLKANTIWPAMHDATTPFYQMPGNAAMARDYGIVVGTSHAEPMMRNNVREWDSKTQGRFNFFSNRQAMLDYWAKRVEETRQDETMVSVGLRGVHDSAMEGAATTAEARAGMEEAIRQQRGILARAYNKSPAQIPQALTLYKEVLEIYQSGLQVPDDITQVWPDDNYGYLQQLNSPAEAGRSGGAGIYYHLSYWGRPHDYLWLASTHPALVREQLERAWQSGARKAWIVNVGDIKPGEYLADYFLEQAFDRGAAAITPQAHLQAWMARQFGPGEAAELAAIMGDYYDLAWERRPEFMGFGQTEPTRPNRQSDYMLSGGDEAERRLARYAALLARVEAVARRIPANRQDALFYLVLYPVSASANIYTRFLKLDLAALYARQGRPLANDYVSQARAAHQAIVADTARYNALAGGKWRHMMDMAPRRLPVFAEPAWPVYAIEADSAAAAAPPAAKTGTIVKIAATAAAPNRLWETVPGLGSQGASLRAAWNLQEDEGAAHPLEYSFASAAEGAARLKIVALPVHPLGPRRQLRIGVSVDGGPLETLDYSTRSRSEEWKLNVLSNSAVRTIALGQLAPGPHRLRIHALDAGFILDRIEVLQGDAPQYYGAPP